MKHIYRLFCRMMGLCSSELTCGFLSVKARVRHKLLLGFSKKAHETEDGPAEPGVQRTTSVRGLFQSRLRSPFHSQRLFGVTSAQSRA